MEIFVGKISYASTRRLIVEEERHQGEVDKMLRKPGDMEAFAL